MITSVCAIVTLRAAVVFGADGYSSVDKTTTSYTAKSRVHMLYVMLAPKVKPALV